MQKSFEKKFTHETLLRGLHFTGFKTYRIRVPQPSSRLYDTVYRKLRAQPGVQFWITGGSSLLVIEYSLSTKMGKLGSRK